jgi:hypothetical protein
MNNIGWNMYYAFASDIGEFSMFEHFKRVKKKKEVVCEVDSNWLD